MILWGVYDFLAKVLLKKHDEFTILFYTQLSGLVVLIPVTLQFGNLHFVELSLMLLLLAAAFLYVGGYWGLLSAFKRAQLSVVSPIAAASSALSASLGIWFLNERLAPIVLLGVGLTVGGVILISSAAKSGSVANAQSIPAGVGYAIITLFSWGFLYALLKVLDLMLDSLSVVAMMRIFAMALMLSIGLLPNVRKSAGRIGLNLALVLFIMGLFDMVAVVSTNLGIASGYVAVVSPVSSAYPAVSIVLAVAFLRERPTSSQVVGIIGVLIGVLLLSITL